MRNDTVRKDAKTRATSFSPFDWSLKVTWSRTNAELTRRLTDLWRLLWSYLSAHEAAGSEFWSLYEAEHRRIVKKPQLVMSKSTTFHFFFVVTAKNISLSRHFINTSGGIIKIQSYKSNMADVCFLLALHYGYTTCPHAPRSSKIKMAANKRETENRIKVAPYSINNIYTYIRMTN